MKTTATLSLYLITAGLLHAQRPAGAELRWTSVNVIIVPDTTRGVEIALVLAAYPSANASDSKPLNIWVQPADAQAFLDALRAEAAASRLVPDTTPTAPVPAGLAQQKPEYVTGPSPVYPLALLMQGIEGTVLVEMIIDTSGRVEPASFRVIASPDPQFTDAARVALLRTRFRSARVDHRPVRCLVVVPVSFARRRR
jgi:protein TonB